MPNKSAFHGYNARESERATKRQLYYPETALRRRYVGSRQLVGRRRRLLSIYETLAVDNRVLALEHMTANASTMCDSY